MYPEMRRTGENFTSAPGYKLWRRSIDSGPNPPGYPLANFFRYPLQVEHLTATFLLGNATACSNPIYLTHRMLHTDRVPWAPTWPFVRCMPLHAWHGREGK